MHARGVPTKIVPIGRGAGLRAGAAGFVAGGPPPFGAYPERGGNGSAGKWSCGTLGRGEHGLARAALLRELRVEIMPSAMRGPVAAGGRGVAARAGDSGSSVIIAGGEGCGAFGGEGASGGVTCGCGSSAALEERSSWSSPDAATVGPTERRAAAGAVCASCAPVFTPPPPPSDVGTGRSAGVPFDFFTAGTRSGARTIPRGRPLGSEDTS